MSEVIAARKSPEMLAYLLRRRSVPVRDLGDPGPSEDQIRTLLTAAARVPDHGRMFPWHFMVFSGAARAQVGEILRRAWAAREPEAATAKLDLEAGQFLRAPLIIGVISRPRPGKHPEWEQILSAGAACQNLCLAANALGFGANWLSEWYAYDDAVHEGLGLDARDRVAGFVYIGTPKVPPEERPRPDLDKIVTLWAPGAPLNRGDGEVKPDA